MPWIIRGLRHGIVTTPWPRRDDEYADQWHGGVYVTNDRSIDDDTERRELETLCPTGAITVDADGAPRLDRGRCILCGRCTTARPDRFGWAHGPAVAQISRTQLVVPNVSETDDTLAGLRAGLAARTRMLRRSVRVRHVDAGSDGAEEWEILALLNPVYDVQRLGIFFTASPRHADILLVTGAGSTGMVASLQRTWDAMPTPTVVVATGTDAISGGLTCPTYATSGGVGDLLPVDIWVPGSPPSPFSVLHGLLLATGRLT